MINKEWHQQHILGSNAPLDARVAWHTEHVQVCGCRGMPKSIADEIARRDEAARTDQPDTGR